MIERNNPDIDVAALLAQVQEEVARARNERQTGAGAGAAGTGPLAESNNPFHWPQLGPTLDIAQQQANVGERLGTMLNYRPAIRWLARIVGRFVLYFGRVITVPQRDFNNAILHALRITLNGIRDMNRTADERFAHLQTRLDELAERLQERADEMARLRGQLVSQQRWADYLKRELMMQHRRIDLLLDEVRRRLGQEYTAEEVAAYLEAERSRLDALYVSFEDQFRGSRDEIKARLEVYLDQIREAGAGAEGAPVLDIGCGRGEWLELLAEQGITAKGVDINETLVHECRERGLDATLGDALAHLRQIPDGALGAVTGFHVIEHLDMDVLLALYRECARVLKPGGVAIFETPNPQNLLVGACNFYADPTHRQPLHPDAQRFLMEYCGLGGVRIEYLHPHEEAFRLPEDEAPELAARLNDLLSCARDYAVIGYRP